MYRFLLTCVLLNCVLPSGVTAAPEEPHADAVLAKARAEAIKGNYEAAASLYAEVRRVYEQAGDLRGQGTVDVHLSSLWVQRGNLAEALRHRQSAYRQFQCAKAGFSQAMTLRELGCLVCFSGDHGQGLEMLDRAIAMFDYLKAPAEVSVTRALLVTMASTDPNPDPARLIAQSRLILANPEARKLSPTVGQAFNGLGLAYASMGDWATAADCFGQAIECLQAEGEPSQDLESAQGNRALALTYLGQAKESALIHEGLAANRQARGDKVRAFMSFINAAVSRRYSGDLPLAERSLDSAEKLVASLEPGPWEALLNINRGRIEFEKGNYQRAVPLLKAACEKVSATAQGAWRFHYYYAAALEKSGDLEGTEKQLRVAASLAEQMRGRVFEFRHRAAYADSRGDVFAKLVSLLMLRGKSVEALEVVEQHKARTFLDLLGSRVTNRPLTTPMPRDFPVAPPATLGQLADASGNEQLRGFAKAWGEAPPKSEPNNLGPPQNDAVQPGDPLPDSQKPKPFASIQKVLRPDECLLVFYLGREQGHGFLITSENLRSWTFSAGRARIGSLVREWRHEIETNRSGEFLKTPSQAENSLFENLLKPIWETLVTSRYKTLYVVADGPLHYAPLQALRNPAGDSLVHHVAVSYVPSGSSLVVLEEGWHVRKGAALLAIANPANDLPALPFALEEAQRSSRFFEKHDLLKDKDATKTKVLDFLPRYDVVLFAGHCQLNPVLPNRSALMLAGKTADRTTRLTVSEIAGLSLRAHLVVLSACETGLAGGRTGQTPAGDDIEGLSRAFILAGVPTVMGTLWQVPDRASAQLVERFVERFRQGGLPPAEALRQAQIGLRASEVASPRAPYYWAGYCMYGLNR